MTRNEFKAFLLENHLEHEVSFAPILKDGYCVRESKQRWEVFVMERGAEYDSIGFPSESDALDYLYLKLLKFICAKQECAAHTPIARHDSMCKFEK